MERKTPDSNHKTGPATEGRPGLLLPVSVISPTDIGRLAREIEAIDDALLQSGLRKDGTPPKVPRTSQLMDRTVQLNKLNLLQPADRTGLQHFLAAVRKEAPVLHVSFSADPSPNFLEKLIAWLRREIDPHVILTIGLQPNIGAGCIVRTPNKEFDFSLRQDFADKRDLLLERLSSLSGQPETVPVPAPEPAGETMP